VKNKQASYPLATYTGDAAVLVAAPAWPPPPALGDGEFRSAQHVLPPLYNV